MTRYLPLLFTAIMFLSMAPNAWAAEIGCESYYSNPVPEENAEKLWPSGARPSTGTCGVGFIRGEIVKGDFETFLTPLWR